MTAVSSQLLPENTAVFKKLFMENSTALQDFLETFLEEAKGNLDEVCIDTIEKEDPIAEFPLYIHAYTKKHQKLHIKIHFFHTREEWATMQMYDGQEYIGYLSRYAGYFSDKKIVNLYILDFLLFTNKNIPYSRCSLMNVDTDKEAPLKYEIVYIELAKYNAEINIHRKQWLQFFIEKADIPFLQE